MLKSLKLFVMMLSVNHISRFTHRINAHFNFSHTNLSIEKLSVIMYDLVENITIMSVTLYV